MFQPESVYIEVSGICSAKCPYCVKGNGLQKQGKYISQADFRRILEHLKVHSLLPKRSIVNLYIWGEPLLHPEINELLRIVAEYGQKAYMSTFLPRPPKLSAESLQILHGMTLSLSGITQESYGRIHGHKIDSILQNFNLLMEAVKRAGVSWRPMVNWHRYRFNESEMEAAREHFEKAGALFAPTVADFNDIKRTERFILNQLDPSEENQLDQDLFTGYLRHCIQQSQKADHECSQWNRLTIDEKGNVLLCCGLANSVEGSVLGPVFDYDAESLRKAKTSSHLCTSCIQNGIAKYCDNQTRFSLDSFLNQHPSERISSLPVFATGKADDTRPQLVDISLPRSNGTTPYPPVEASELLQMSVANSSAQPPLVTIGVPLYNEERFIAQTLDSLLGQDYQNWEMVISDDASSDRSGEICQEYARKDPRIRYLRNRNNLGCVRNCNRLAELANGDYFLWGFQHDLYESTYLSRCVGVMHRQPELALCYSRTALIDEDGKPLGLAPDVVETQGLSSAAAFQKLLREMVSGNMIFGLFRTDLLAQTSLFRNCLGHDLVLAGELSLKGGIAQIQEPLFHRRQNRSQESPQAAHERWIRMLRADGPAAVAPYLFMIGEYLKVIRGSTLPTLEQEQLVLEVITRFGPQAQKETDPLIKDVMGRLQKNDQAPRVSRLQSSELLSLCELVAIVCEGDSNLQGLRSLCLQNLDMSDQATGAKLHQPASLASEVGKPSPRAGTRVLSQTGAATIALGVRASEPSSRTLPRISFVTIVLNGMPFLEYCLKAVYEVAHEIFIVEGAVEQCLFAANSDGSSKDGTVECIRNFPDPEHKIRLIQGRWPEKVDMQNAALKRVTGEYVWLADSDEIYKGEDLLAVQKLLQEDPSVTQVNFIPDNFWKGFDYIVSSPGLFQKDAHFRRLFKFVPGAVFTSHRPPTLVWPGSDRTTEQMHLIDGFETRRRGLTFCHYSYVDDHEVRQKIELYRRYSWGQNWKVDLGRWYEECFQKWTPTNREAIERDFPIWTADKNSCTELFQGTHPQVMQDFICNFNARHVQNPAGTRQSAATCSTQSRSQLKLLGFTHYETGRYAEALACFDQLLGPSRPEQGLQFIRGKCLLELGRKDEAAKELRAELEIQPNHPDAKALLESIQSGRQSENDTRALSWEALKAMPVLRLYAGDVPETSWYAGLIGLSLSQANSRHLRHDVTRPLLLPDQSVDSFQSEDVFEHIAYEKLASVINEIHRVLKPGATFRLSLPDYGCDVLQGRSLKDQSGRIVFDPGGGGTLEKPGHVWFPTYPNVKQLLDQTHFAESGEIKFLHYYRPDSSFVADPVDYSKGYVQRTPDHDRRVQHPYRPMSIIVDLIKGSTKPLRLWSTSSNSGAVAETVDVTAVRTGGVTANASVPHGNHSARTAEASSSRTVCEEARSLLGDGKLAEAEKAVQIALAQHPNDPEASLLFREVRLYRAIGPANRLKDVTPAKQSQIEPSSDEVLSLEARFPGVTLGVGVQVIGLRNVSIGNGSCIADHTWINVCLRDEQVRLIVGRCVLVGRQSMISTGGHLEIGDYCVLAPRVYISDADHVFSDVGRPILQQGATLGRSVIIEENCWLGINTVVSGSLTVGRGSVVGANSVVIDDVPPFCVVAGSPATIVKMHNPLTRRWERTRTPEDRERIQKARELAGLPDRAEYRQILAMSSTLKQVDPIVAGRGLCI
jgi:carbonic anhydrase/acetyltransferase-like protein (isoleucine patch superfamily)/MoaA/NifB/PqqE/SkfB family radical SAM enzyme/tetratricopeptide (TPR) repeat protein